MLVTASRPDLSCLCVLFGVNGFRCVVQAALLSLESTVEVRGSGHAALATEWPLIGRRAEWDRAVAAWQAAVAGQARVLVVTGEAGIGKTRLVQELEAAGSTSGNTCKRALAWCD